jgi:flagellar protein FliS
MMYAEEKTMNRPSDAYGLYLRTNIETASPEKLVVMLYDGLLRFLNQACIKIREKKIEESHYFLIRSQNIVNELTMSLKQDGSEMARNLSGLYTYIHQQLVMANLTKNEATVKEIVDLVRPLRDAWQQALTQSCDQSQPGTQVLGAQQSPAPLR